MASALLETLPHLSISGAGTGVLFNNSGVFSHPE